MSGGWYKVNERPPCKKDAYELRYAKVYEAGAEARAVFVFFCNFVKHQIMSDALRATVMPEVNNC